MDGGTQLEPTQPVAPDAAPRGGAPAAASIAIRWVAGETGAREARLAAQTDAVALYEQADFEVVSGVFEEAGIPHVWMSRSLAGRP